jgi:ABC-type microcin C transport system duplicated ATPase subunit YejF
MNKAILEIQNLSLSTKTCAGQSALVNCVSLAVDKNTIHALVGESGSGKSLTALAIMNLLPDTICFNDKSKIIFNATDCIRCSEKDMRAMRRTKIGFIFQDAMTAFNPVKTIYKQIQERVTDKQNAKSIIFALLNDVGIKDVQRCIRSYPHQLSGGQRQRAMIALALANEPELLIADEPTTALDVSVQKQVIDLLRRCQQERSMAMLFITHDLALVQQIADEITVLKHGRVLENSSAKDFFNSPKTDYAKDLLASCPDLEAKLELTPSPSVLDVKDVQVKFKTGYWWQKDAIKTALGGVSLSLNKGQTLAVIGESAAGKSTLAKAIVGLQKYTGQINSKYKNATHMIFQDSASALDPRFTIRQSLCEGARTVDGLEEKIHNALINVGLVIDILDSYPHQFSGGQRQRICIARALVCDSKILILDEPTSALDVKLADKIMDLLLRLQREHDLSYILITHNLGVVAKMAHQTAVMHAGMLVELDSTKNILKNPQHDITRQLLRAVPILSAN